MIRRPDDTEFRAAVVLFDLDGTLSDSAPGILAALRHAFVVNELGRAGAEPVCAAPSDLLAVLGLDGADAAAS